jgi:CheY-like chemotaxis protein
VEGSSSVRRVMVVDDDPGVLDILQIALQAEGYEVMLARNGLEALDLAGEQLPHLMLVDLMMPIMDGWELVRQFRGRDGFASVPIIILSAAREIERERATLGVEAALAKPFDLLRLLTAVSAWASA